jgi:predicted nucleotide-binding protein
LGSEYPVLWKQVSKSLAERLLQRNRQIANTNDRSRVFVISSVEALELARAVQELLVYDDVTVFVWAEGVFRASQYAVESLAQQLEMSDFAVAVLQGDDVIHARGQEHPAPRDNVLFELGMFIGRLGRHRTFLLQPMEAGVKLPTDLSGINTIPYKEGTRADILANLGPACNQLRRCFEELGPK